MLTLNDGRSELWQWDTGRALTVDADCSQVHFSNKVFGRSIDVDVVDGVADIPDILLQTDKDLNVWVFVGTAENGYTKISKTFKVNRRNKPSDYVFTPPDQTSLEEIKERIDALEEKQDPDAIKNAVEDYLEQNPVEVPVQSVNGRTGEVKLTAKDLGAISQDDLQEATNEALAQAKASGEFDGKDGQDGQDGYTPQKGVDYFDGRPGKDGADGEPGQPGKDGNPGKDGVSATHKWSGTTLTITSASGTSSADLKGDKGDKGDTGPQGPQGEKGDTGQKGEQGAQGPAGADGKTAYQYAVEGGYTGTEAEFTAKMAAEIPAVDDTLTASGKAADAAVVGARLDSLSEEIANIPSGKDGADGQDGITPTIGDNGNWYLGETDTGVKAKGENGNDGKGIKSISRTSGTGAAGTTDTYTITYTDDATSTYTVYNGKDGTNGTPGTSVTVKSVTESTADGGSNVVEFSDGKTLTVKNGNAGTPGKDGYTPVKGKDYFDGEDYVLTDTDKEEIAEKVPIVKVPGKPVFANGTSEMTDTDEVYVNLETGTFWRYAETTVTKEVTKTDTIVATDENQYQDGYRLGSSGDAFNVAAGYHITPLIDLAKAEYDGKTIQLHLEGCQYASEATYAYYIQCRIYGLDMTVLALRPYTAETKESASYIMGCTNGITVDYISETEATITIANPTYGAENIAIGYIRFCGKGAVTNSNIYITYTATETVVESAWVDTGISYSSNTGDEETAAKVAWLNNEGADPKTVTLLPADVLAFYNSAAYPDDDYTVTHLEKITYPYRADIPVPYTVKWNYNESAMRTTVAVDTRAIGTVNAYTLRTYDATGLNKFPIYNLLPNKTYYYKVTHVLSDGSLVEAKSGSFTTSSETWRLLYIDGTQNVRDLGGWTGLNGKKVKYGKIIRGAALNDSSIPELLLTGKGWRSFGELAIQAELNLGAADTETSIAANCVYKNIAYTNYAIAITGETYRVQFKEVLEWIVDCLTASKPVYMHCQGGCDRTGTLSFQLLGLLGVSESDLSKEYELSSFSNIGLGRLRTTTKAVDTYDYVGMVEALKAYSGDTVVDKFYDFATTGCGISEDTITNFRNLMLE